MGLQSLLRFLALAYYRWALKEIDPRHPDLPHVMLRIRELERAKRRHDSGSTPSFRPVSVP
jgi:hypothetical protein